MTDDELKDRIVDLICRRWRRFHEETPIEAKLVLRGNFAAQWTKILGRAGCISLPWDYPAEDNDDLFVRHPALGVIRVPREVAMKILVLGELP